MVKRSAFAVKVASVKSGDDNFMSDFDENDKSDLNRFYNTLSDPKASILDSEKSMINEGPFDE
jgi:hypothetical protein